MQIFYYIMEEVIEIPVASLPKDIYLLILKKTRPIDRVDILCTCKYFLDICLRNLWCPWLQSTSKKFNHYYSAYGSTGLEWALDHNYIDYVIKWSAVAISNCKTTYLTNVLFYACNTQCIEVVKFLMTDDKIVWEFKEKSDNLIIMACKSGNYKIVKSLLSNPSISVPTYNEMKANFKTRGVMTYGENEFCCNIDVFKILWSDSRISRHIGIDMLTNIIKSNYNDSKSLEVSQLIISQIPFKIDTKSLVISQMPFKIDTQLLELAYNHNHTRILKMILRHPDMVDFDYDAFKLALTHYYSQPHNISVISNTGTITLSTIKID